MMRTALLLTVVGLLSPAMLVAQKPGGVSVRAVESIRTHRSHPITPPLQITDSTAPLGSLEAARTRGRRTVFVWIGGGLGVSSVGVGGSANLSVQYGGAVISLRTASVFDGLLWIQEDWSDVGILLGAGTTGSGYGHASVAVGLARVGGTHYTRHGGLFSSQTSGSVDTSRVGPYLGLPVEVQGFVQAGVIGIGLYVYGDINSARSFGGISLYLQLGKLR